MEFRTFREYIQCHLENPGQMPYHFGNKLEVRELAKKLGINTPRIYAKRLDIENVNFNSLPDRFVIKPDNLHSMSGVRMLKRIGKNRYHEFFSNANVNQETVKKYLTSLIKPYRINTYIIEEFISGPLPEHVHPLDYKIHVFNGKTMFIEQDHRGSNPISVVFTDANFVNLTGELTFTSSKWQIAEVCKPDNSNEMLKAAERIGEKLNIPYVRVDMYSDNKKIYLGEVTLYPGGIYKGDYYKISKSADEYCGGLIRAAYKKNGWSIPEFFKKLPEKYYRTSEDIARDNAAMENFLNDCVHEILDVWKLDRKPLESRNLHFMNNFNKFYSIYKIFADEESRELYLKLLRLKLAMVFMPDEDAYRHFGIFSEKEWERLKKTETYPDICVDDSYLLDKIEIFLLEAYRYKDFCRVKKGDVVLDCGAYTGNSALFFANMAGKSGHIYAFELDPGNFRQLERNVHEKKTENMATISPVPMGVFNRKASVALDIHRNYGPATRIGSETGTGKINVIPIDDFVREKELERIDFIKMDIEGAEERALEGAAETIRKHHPEMAICIYHKPDDYYRIVESILKINPKYEFYLKHNSFNIGETVLFCVPARFPAEIAACEKTGRLQACQDFFIMQRDERVRYFRLNLYKRIAALLSDAAFPDLNAATFSDKSYWILPVKYFPRNIHYEILVKNTVCAVEFHIELLPGMAEAGILEDLQEKFEMIRIAWPKYRVTLSEAKYSISHEFPLRSMEETARHAAMNLKRMHEINIILNQAPEKYRPLARSI